MKVVFYMRAQYKEQHDDLLLCASSKGQKRLTDIGDWERSVILEYVTLFLETYRKWESNGKVRDPRTGIEHEVSGALNLGSVRLDATPDPSRPMKRVLKVGDKTGDWLKRALAFYRVCDRAIREKTKGEKLPKLEMSETKARSVGELIQLLVEDRAWRLLAESDKKEIQEEAQGRT